MFWTGFARYSTTVPSEPEVPPVIVSPVMNFCCDVMNNLEFLESSTNTFAVALEVEPVIISSLIKKPLLPAPSSVTILSPSVSSKT